jgi:hypothetical protein
LDILFDEAVQGKFFGVVEVVGDAHVGDTEFGAGADHIGDLHGVVGAADVVGMHVEICAWELSGHGKFLFSS